MQSSGCGRGGDCFCKCGICDCCRSAIVKCMLCCGTRVICGVVVVVVVMVGYWRWWWDSGGDGCCKGGSCD